MMNEVVEHKEISLREKDALIMALRSRLKITEEENNESAKQKKKMGTDKTKLEKELKEYQDLLAATQKKLTILQVRESTVNSMEEVLDNEASNKELKCNFCDSILRNEAILESCVAMDHKQTQDHKFKACNKSFSSNGDLELHMVDKHTDEADCSKCNAFFKKEC